MPRPAIARGLAQVLLAIVGALLILVAVFAVFIGALFLLGRPASSTLTTMAVASEDLFAPGSPGDVTRRYVQVNPELFGWTPAVEHYVANVSRPTTAGDTACVIVDVTASPSMRRVFVVTVGAGASVVAVAVQGPDGWLPVRGTRTDCLGP
jgi:hypothetical protein